MSVEKWLGRGTERLDLLSRLEWSYPNLAAATLFLMQTELIPSDREPDEWLVRGFVGGEPERDVSRLERAALSCAEHSTYETLFVSAPATGLEADEAATRRGLLASRAGTRVEGTLTSHAIKGLSEPDRPWRVLMRTLLEGDESPRLLVLGEAQDGGSLVYDPANVRKGLPKVRTVEPLQLLGTAALHDSFGILAVQRIFPKAREISCSYAHLDKAA